jgi:hypothetical protein
MNRTPQDLLGRRWTVHCRQPQQQYVIPLDDGRELRIEVQWPITFTSAGFRHHIQSGGVQPPAVPRLVRAEVWKCTVAGLPWAREGTIERSAIDLV